MVVFLPPGVFLIFFLILRHKDLDWRRATLASAIFCATCVVAITEIASSANLVTRAAVAIFWSLICLGALVYYGIAQRRISPPPQSRATQRERLDLVTQLLLAAAAIIRLPVRLTPIVAPPTT